MDTTLTGRRVYLQASYCISDERVSLFNPVGDRRKVEEKLSVTKKSDDPLNLKSLRLNVGGSREQLIYYYASYKV